MTTLQPILEFQLVLGIVELAILFIAMLVCIIIALKIRTRRRMKKLQRMLAEKHNRLVVLDVDKLMNFFKERVYKYIGLDNIAWAIDDATRFDITPEKRRLLEEAEQKEKEQKPLIFRKKKTKERRPEPKDVRDELDAATEKIPDELKEDIEDEEVEIEEEDDSWQKELKG